MDQQIEMTLGEISALVGGDLHGDPGTPINGVAGLDEAGPGKISFLANPLYMPQLVSTRASAVLVDREVATPADRVVVRVDDPSKAFSTVVDRFSPPAVRPAPGIHPTAVMADGVELGHQVCIGAHAVIEPGVRIGDHSIIYPLCYVGHETEVGEGCVLHAGVVVRERVTLGDQVTVHAGSVIGSDGYGYLTVEGKHLKIPQVGTVVIEDEVEIGANCTIDRARFGETRIGSGTKIDNLVHVGHNVQIGAHSVLVAQVGVSGSTRIGKYCVLAGQAGISGHLTLGDGAVVAGNSGVTHDVPPGGKVGGAYAQPYKRWLTQRRAIKRLPQLRKTVNELVKRITELEAQAKDDQATG